MFALALAVYGSYGVSGRLGRDAGNHLYAAQQMAEGIPPYVSAFNHKTPVGTMLAGMSVMAGRALGVDDVVAVRLAFLVLGALSAVAVYLLVIALTDSVAAGWFAALTFLACAGFGRAIALGPQPKTPLVLFETASLLAMARARWFSAGACAGLALLTWQPTAVPVPVAFVLAWRQRDRDRSWRAPVAVVLGASIPVAAVLAYFARHGALHALLDGAILFNLLHLERPPHSLVDHLLAPARVVVAAFPRMALPIALGLLAPIVLFALRRRRHSGWIATLLDDRLAPIFLSLPCVVVWSLVDFQSSSDFFPFLPYVAIGLALPLDAIARGPWRRAIASAIAAGLLALVYLSARDKPLSGLDRQRAMVAAIEAQVGASARLVAIGGANYLGLARRRSPTPYVFLANGIDRYIEATFPGGFHGWLEALGTYDPDVVVVGRNRGEGLADVEAWLAAHYRLTSRGRWAIWVRPRPGG